MLRKVIHKLSAPLRWCIRQELVRAQCAESQNITLERHRQSLVQTTRYVEQHMRGVDSVDSSLLVLDTAIRHITVEDGLILEFGVFSGTTINHIASRVNRHIFGFDSFEGLPERWRDGIKAGEFKVTDLPRVVQNVSLVKGWFNETLPRFLQEHRGPVGFVHIDCDLYSSTVTVFEELHDRIIPGTVIAFDEYFNYPGWEDGEFKAFQEYCLKYKVKYQYLTYNSKHEQIAVKILNKG